MRSDRAKKALGAVLWTCVAVTVLASLLLWIFRAWLARFPTETF